MYIENYYKSVVRHSDDYTQYEEAHKEQLSLEHSTHVSNQAFCMKVKPG